MDFAASYGFIYSIRNVFLVFACVNNAVEKYFEIVIKRFLMNEFPSICFPVVLSPIVSSGNIRQLR